MRPDESRKRGLADTAAHAEPPGSRVSGPWLPWRLVRPAARPLRSVPGGPGRNRLSHRLGRKRGGGIFATATPTTPPRSQTRAEQAPCRSAPPGASVRLTAECLPGNKGLGRPDSPGDGVAPVSTYHQGPWTHAAHGGAGEKGGWGGGLTGLEAGRHLERRQRAGAPDGASREGMRTPRTALFLLRIS